MRLGEWGSQKSKNMTSSLTLGEEKDLETDFFSSASKIMLEACAKI